MNSDIYEACNAPLALPDEVRWTTSAPGANLHGPIMRAIDTVFVWTRRARERRYLEHLEPRLLQDMGLTEADVAEEADKPFWQA